MTSFSLVLIESLTKTKYVHFHLATKIVIVIADNLKKKNTKKQNVYTMLQIDCYLSGKNVSANSLYTVFCYDTRHTVHSHSTIFERNFFL